MKEPDCVDSTVTITEWRDLLHLFRGVEHQLAAQKHESDRLAHFLHEAMTEYSQDMGCKKGQFLDFDAEAFDLLRKYGYETPDQDDQP